MKRLIPLLLLVVLATGTTHAKLPVSSPSRSINQQNTHEELLKYLGQRIKYPANAITKNLQGTTTLLFTLKNGKLSDLQILNELGAGCDVEVLNVVLAYPAYNLQKDGKYALNTNFKLGEGPTTFQDNKIPEGYQLLEITIVGIPPVATKAASIKIFDNQNNLLNDNSNRLIIRAVDASINQPKVVVDGASVDYEWTNVLNPEDIESISILKGVSAILKFGESGINGAIIITTKQKPRPKDDANKQPKSN